MTEVNAIDSLKPAKLAALLDIKKLTVWDGEDPGSILRKQLDVPLVPDVFSAPQVEQLYGHVLSEGYFASKTFEDALQAPWLPKEVFKAIKEFAQYVQNLPESPIRGGPATVLYYAAIAACLSCGEQISTLRPDQLYDGFAWASDQPGAEGLQHVFEQARAACTRR